MPKPKLQVVGKDPEPPRGNPELIALLERLLFDAKSGELVGLIALIETGACYDMVEANDWGEFPTLGLLEWAKQSIFVAMTDEDE